MILTKHKRLYFPHSFWLENQVFPDIAALKIISTKVSIRFLYVPVQSCMEACHLFISRWRRAGGSMNPARFWLCLPLCAHQSCKPCVLATSEHAHWHNLDWWCLPMQNLMAQQINIEKINLGTPSGHHRDMTGTPSGHHRDTINIDKITIKIATPSGHHRNTIGTPSGHDRDTIGTPSGHVRDTLGTEFIKSTWNVWIVEKRC